MKRVIFGTLLPLLAFSCSVLPDEADEDWGEKGTVQLGFCWIIVTADSAVYKPINLDEKYKSEGQGVRFEYKERSDLDSVCMQGTIIELTRIEKL